MRVGVRRGVRGRRTSLKRSPLPRAPSPKRFTVGRCWGRGRFSKRSASPPRPPLPKRRRGELGNAGGGGFSKRSPSLAPPPEEQLGIGLCVPSEVRAHATWARFPVLALWSRRLTEPPRPCGAGDEPLRPLRGHLPFQGRLCVEACPKGSLVEGVVLPASHSIRR